MAYKSLIDFGERYKLDTKKPLKIIECFAGYGSQALSLKYLGIPFEHHKICEWAVPSIQAYKDLHFNGDDRDFTIGKTEEELSKELYDLGISSDYSNPMSFESIKRKSLEWKKKVYNNIKITNNLVNIMKVKGRDLDFTDNVNETIILTYSFPCQDISLAGRQGGLSVSQANGGTRSGLLWEIERILDERRSENLPLPNCLIMENVPALISGRNKPDFYKWVTKLEDFGYNNYYQLLNAKDYGYPEPIPQNRNRIFMVSLLGDYDYKFPNKQKLKLKLKDLLETNVDEKYYLSQKMINCFLSDGTGRYPRRERFLQNITKETGIGNSITTLAGNRATDNFVLEYGNKRLNETLEENEIHDKDFIDVYNKTVKKDVAGTITTRVSKSNDTFIAEKLCDEMLESETSEENIGLKVVGKLNINGYDALKKVYSLDGLSPTLDTMGGGNRQPKVLLNNNLQIRKLTSKECFRLMGVKDEDYEKIKVNQSESSLYHLAGDSIVVNVLEAIIKNLL